MREIPGRAVHPEPVVELRGSIADDLVDYARRKVATVLAHVHRPVVHSHVRVVRAGDPARETPVTARTVVELDGGTVQVHADAARPREAVDRLVDRLSRRLARVAARPAPRRAGRRRWAPPRRR